MPGRASPSPRGRFHTPASESLLEPSRGLPWSVFAEHAPQDAAALPDRHVVGKRGFEHRHQVLASTRGALEVGEMAFHRGLRAPGSKLLQGTRLRDLLPRADAHDL